MTVSGPDFLCVGQQKAATTWLYDQLQYHPDFWMPPVKELHYLSRHFPHHKTLADLARAEGPPNKVVKWQQRRTEMNLRPLEERDFEFFQLVRSLEGEPYALERYEQLFRFKGTRQSGDISPSYATLAPQAIGDVTDFFPSLKVILHVRDPVQRAWSAINKRLRVGEFDEARLEDPRYLLDLISMPAFLARSFGTKIARKWMDRLMPDRFLIVLFDDIAADPGVTLDRVLTFLGAQSGTGALETSFNRKESHAKIAMSDSIRDVLVGHFADELRESADLFGGAAVGWPARYGLR